MPVFCFKSNGISNYSQTDLHGEGFHGVQKTVIDSLINGFDIRVRACGVTCKDLFMKSGVFYLGESRKTENTKGSYEHEV